MSKDRKIHEFIEAQTPKAKQRNIEIVMQRIREHEQTQQAEQPQAVAPVKKPFPWKKFAAIATPALGAVGIGVGLLVWLLPNAPVTPAPESRYCEASEYTEHITTVSLCEYAQNTDQDLLYFSWYAETDFSENKYYELNNDSKEIICYQEKLVDINTGCLVTLSVTDSYTTLELFNSYENLPSSSTIQDVEISWRYNQDESRAIFEYEGYTYYLEVVRPFEEEYILELVEELLP